MKPVSSSRSAIIPPHIEVEQDRASHVLPYHTGLAGNASHQPPRRRRTIAATTTATGLKIRREIDTNSYAEGIKVSDDDMKTRDITREAFHPEWNYTIAPHTKNVER